MAEVTKNVEISKQNSNAVAAMSAARKAKQNDGVQKPVIDVRNRFALNQLLQAGRGCKVLSQQIRAGGSVNSEVIRAASVLSGAVAAGMLDE